jgi:hypothetical protein
VLMKGSNPPTIGDSTISSTLFECLNESLGVF